MFLSLLNPFADMTYSYGYNASSSPNAAVTVIIVLIALAITIFLIAAMWRVFTKAGRPGWAAIIPIYNNWVGYEIAGRPGWWAIISLIPFVNIIGIVLWIIACIEIAKRFGKSGAFGFFLLFLIPIIGWPILGFGDARYQGGSGVGGAAFSSSNGYDSPQAHPVFPPSSPEGPDNTPESSSQMAAPQAPGSDVVQPTEVPVPPSATPAPAPSPEFGTDNSQPSSTPPNNLVQ